MADLPSMEDMFDHFYVITPIMNSPRYRVRAENYRKFKTVCDNARMKLITVEAAFGDRPFEVTERDNPMNVQLRTVDELWLKENMINIGIEYMLQLDPDAKYVAWIDSDTFPMCPPKEWFELTYHGLQHYEIIQMWQYLINFGPDYQPVSGTQMSFMATYAAAGFTVPRGKNVPHTLAGHSGLVSLGRPGLAWAANLEALKKVGGLPDRCILGSGDWHLAHALVEAMETKSAEMKISAYSEYLFHVQELCSRWIKKDVGYVPVTVGHWYHGNKVDRKYDTRGQLLIEANYNPYRDIKKDPQGLYCLETWTPEQVRLRDLIRNYFATRNEDSVPLR